MKFANIRGRGSIVNGAVALDIERSTAGALSSDPSVYAQLDAHPELAEVLRAADNRDFTEFSLDDLGPPVPRPGKVIAVALNYHSHASEASRETASEPVVFAKFSSAVCGPYDAIAVAPTLTRVDYEAEVVVAIGRTGRDLDPSESWAHIAGVTIGQDISDREEQWREPLSQFSFAKSYDTFAPIGPYLVTVDEFSDPDDIEIIGRVDDLEVQHATTKELIASIPALVAWISRRTTLEPGDLVFTGTPAGVGAHRKPPLFLRAGMTVETEIPEIGAMRNPVRESSTT